MGTGALTSFSGDRDAQVPAVNDAAGFLSIRASNGPNSQYFDPSSGPNDPAAFVFGDDVGGDGFNNGTTFIDDLFVIGNQSAQSQYVWIQEDGNNGGDKATAFYTGTGPSDGQPPDKAISVQGTGQKPRDLQPQKDDPVPTEALFLNTGDAQSIGFVVKTDRVEGPNRSPIPSELLNKVTIKAVADSADLPSVLQP